MCASFPVRRSRSAERADGVRLLQRARRVLWQALALVACAVPEVRSQQAPATDCLIPLARTWGTIRYFHPTLATPSIRWDSVGVAAIESLDGQCDQAAISRALRHLIAPLHDPVTRIIGADVPPVASTRGASGVGVAVAKVSPSARWQADSVLVLELGSMHDAEAATTALGQQRALVSQARRVVIDLRGTVPSQSETLTLALRTSRIDRALLTRTLCAAAPRRRVHAGLPSGDAPQEFVGWREPQVPCVPGETAVPKQAVVFLADSLSAVPLIAPAMRAAGLATIIGVGPVSDESHVALDTIVFPAGIRAQVRLSGADACGMSGLLADTTVSDADAISGDLPLRIARTFALRKPAPPQCDALPVIAGRFAPRDSLFPSRAWRMLSAFEIYNAVRFFDPHLDLIGSDGSAMTPANGPALDADQRWDRIVTAELSALANAATRRDYMAAISRLGAALNDGHALFPPNRLLSLFGAGFPPVVVMRAEGQFIVREVLDSVAAGGVRRGDIIRTIDGAPVSVRFDAVRPLVPGSNPAARDASATTFTFAGADSSRVAVGVVSAGAAARTVTWQRRTAFLPPTFNPARGPAMRELAGNVGYADLRLLQPAQVDSMFDRFRTARALILDLRGYPQGTHPLIARRLTATRLVASRIRQPVIDAPDQRVARTIIPGISQHSAHFTEFTQYVEPDGRPVFAGRVFVLIDERAVSQAEQAALFYRTAGRATLVGSNTAGANGDVTSFAVPGRVGFAFTGLVALSADGIGMQGAGLSPDVRVTPTIRGIRAGRDEVLDCAHRLARGVAVRCDAASGGR